MSSPAADSAAPIAVLVLAWDETTPAVRALVDATQAPDPSVASILVMVPQSAAPDALSAEEYLPLSDDLLSASPATVLPAAALSALPPDLAATTPNTFPEQPPIGPADTGSGGELPALAAAPTENPALPTATPTELGWSAVRVIRLGNLNLPELALRAGRPLPAPIWMGQPAAPVAPYLGAIAAEELTQAEDAPPTTALSAPSLAPVLGTTAVSLPPTPPRPSYEPAEPRPQAPSPEGDLLPLEAVELANFEQSSADLLVADFEVGRSPALAAQPDDWAEALASLSQPPADTPAATLPTPSAEDESPASLPAPPAARQYAEPNLNFKIIQYARFTVPLVLAEEPYAAIYAPAWPTWLAAQELRRRTGWPLVVHVADLAAAADEPLDTATSWMAELQRQALRRADVILAETPALAQRLRHELSLPAGTVHTVPAADTAAIAQALQAARPRPATDLP